MQREDALIFEPVRPADYDRIFAYTSVYGEGSCQHSPVSMASMEEKYGDAVCIRDGFLYTLRSRLEDEHYRVYLAPLGEGDEAAAYEKILADAAAHDRLAKFVTLTERSAKRLKKLFPGRFDYLEVRDQAEYLYRVETMAEFPGGDLRKRRMEVHTFWNTYGDRASVTRITPEDFPACLAYEEKWLRDNLETHDSETLWRDARMIKYQMARFDVLHLSGVILRVDGEVGGFCYGTRLGDIYDVIVEKAERGIPHAYKVIRQESTRLCAQDCKYVNMEEDVGLPGLRALKMAYKPDRLLNKFIVTERRLS